MTTSVLGRVVRFDRAKDYEMLEANIEFYRKRDSASIYAYVLMPTHFHLIIGIPAKGSLSDFMRDLKRRTAREYFELYDMPAGRLWENRFDDVNLHSEEMFITKFNYIHMNPVKAGLVEKPEDWPYSSAGYYSVGKPSRVIISNIEL